MILFFFLMTRRPPRPTRTNPPCPYTTLFPSPQDRQGTRDPLLDARSDLPRTRLQTGRPARLSRGRRSWHRLGPIDIQFWRSANGDKVEAKRTAEIGRAHV